MPMLSAPTGATCQRNCNTINGYQGRYPARRLGMAPFSYGMLPIQNDHHRTGIIAKNDLPAPGIILPFPVVSFVHILRATSSTKLSSSKGGSASYGIGRRWADLVAGEAYRDPVHHQLSRMFSLQLMR